MARALGAGVDSVVNPKYAVYVWSSYGLTLAVLIWNVLMPQLRRAELKRRLAQPESEQENGVSEIE
jgi:heme exporter protein CcmD